MTRIIVNDASCLIDLRKGRLLAALCKLPYRLVVPQSVRESEVLEFSKEEWQLFDDAGMITHDLSPDQVAEGLAFKERHPALSANDCFCLVTARTFRGVLLTGDSLLRRVATEHGLRVHGVLWVIDELDADRVWPKPLLAQALRTWQRDDSVFLPHHEITSRLEQLAKPAVSQTGCGGYRRRCLINQLAFKA